MQISPGSEKKIHQSLPAHLSVGLCSSLLWPTNSHVAYLSKMNFPVLLLAIISALFYSNIIFVNAQLLPDIYYENCAPLPCGNSIIQYPFGDCGLLSAYCKSNQTVILSLDGSHFWKVVGDITESSYSNRTLRIDTRDDDRTHSDDFNGTYGWLTMGGIFSLSQGYEMGTIFNCTRQPFELISSQRVDCETFGFYCYFYPDINLTVPSCIHYIITIPAKISHNISYGDNFQQALQTGFQISWSTPQYCNACVATGGRCLSRFYYNDFLVSHKNYVEYCTCPNGTTHLFDCYGVEIDGDILRYTLNGNRESIHKQPTKHKHIAALISTLCAVFSIVVVSAVIFRRRIGYKKPLTEEQQSIRAFMDPIDCTPHSIENFLNYYSSQVPTRYSYSQITAYTNNLANKIGKGGFGTVYKGKLPSGRLIAVKILDEAKQSEQQFIAEVATVGITYHVNLVRLLGYCSDGSKRALVYEYMVNGSLDKYVHGGELDLNWKQLYAIAVGTARGIAYLHQDCRNHILHCDIKPHNILLDEDFCPKVADFGLAKISDRGESHISVVNRGTLGYAAPEMWSRMYGPVTDRSDVYSYGMLVMEMVGGRKNMDIDNIESRSSQFFYTEWAFRQIEKGQFGNLRKGNMSEEDQSIAKKLSLIGMWCIQFKASNRPPMSKVIQMLEGDIDIATPPFPFPHDTPLQLPVSNQPSSTNVLEVHSSTQTAKNSRLRSVRRTYSFGSTLGDQSTTFDSNSNANSI